MTDYYIIVLVLLFVFAISDLIVGVSNDAVNFLNSAIGSKVTSRRNIMIVASLGILVGATFSSGMMEVARKGIFNPQYFYFSEIMVLFIAVMITDIILLDLFNTFGMPTSTTVSIVFELLGAAFAVSVLKIATNGDPMGSMGEYINTSSALVIISGIFLSVFIAFVIGSIVQYLSRLLFTFQFSSNMKWVHYIWCGLSLTALTYFLFIKGIAGASFISENVVATVQEQTEITLLVSVVVWSFIMALLHKLVRINILKIVVLFGTFALAMAFSGNDLVNFIGVPIAGFESFMAWKGSGMAAEAFSMEILLQPIQSKSYMLLIAGGIMIITLWFSKKARSVTETEVNLGRQNEGGERFKPNGLSKIIVRYSLAMARHMSNLVPKNWRKETQKRFDSPSTISHTAKDQHPPAFDLVRASVNLTVASILIAFATSLKLPLSTTYVSFMVAMGTSLSDRAWGRNSAVFRVAGVLNVIGGWLATAVLAFIAAAAFATFIFYFHIKALGLLLLLVVLLVSRTFLLHKKKQKEKEAQIKRERTTTPIAFSESIEQTAQMVASALGTIRDAYENTINGLLLEDLTKLKTAQQNIAALNQEQEILRHQIFSLVKRFEDQPKAIGRLHLLVYDLMQDMVQSTVLITESCFDHVANSLAPIAPQHSSHLQTLKEEVYDYLDDLIQIISNQSFDTLSPLMEDKKKLFCSLEMALSEQIEDIQKDSFSVRNSLLLFTLLLETKDMIAVAIRFTKLYARIEPNAENETYFFLSKW